MEWEWGWEWEEEWVADGASNLWEETWEEAGVVTWAAEWAEAGAISPQWVEDLVEDMAEEDTIMVGDIPKYPIHSEYFKNKLYPLALKYTHLNNNRYLHSSTLPSSTTMLSILSQASDMQILLLGSSSSISINSS